MYKFVTVTFLIMLLLFFSVINNCYLQYFNKNYYFYDYINKNNNIKSSDYVINLNKNINTEKKKIFFFILFFFFFAFFLIKLQGARVGIIVNIVLTH